MVWLQLGFTQSARRFLPPILSLKRHKCIEAAMCTMWSRCCLEERLTRRLKRQLSSKATVPSPSSPLTATPHLSPSPSGLHSSPTPPLHLRNPSRLLHPWPCIARMCVRRVHQMGLGRSQHSMHSQDCRHLRWCVQMPCMLKKWVKSVKTC